MPTTQDNMLSRPVQITGGIHRELSQWTPAGGLFTCKGMHGYQLDKLMKWSGSELFNTTQFGSGLRVNGLFQATLGTNTFFFAMVGGIIYRVDYLGGGFAQLKTGEVPAYYDAKVLGSLLFLASGNNPNRKIDGSLNVQNVGIAAPTAVPVIADGGAGALTGTAYSHKYTFRNSVTGQESNPSPVSNSLNITNRQITVSGLNDSTDPQVDRKVIYRCTSTNQGQWFRVAEIIAAQSTYLDNVSDGNLGEQVLEDNGVPPQSKYLEVYNGMIVYAGLAAPDQSKVLLSGVLRPEAVDEENDYDLDPEEADIITGVKKFGGAIAAYKRKGLFLGSGESPDQMTFIRTRVTEGALGNRGIVAYKSSHLYLSERGPHAFSGLMEEYIGRAIEEIYKTLDLTSLMNASGVYYNRFGFIIWNVKSVGAGDYDSWLIFNVDTKEWYTRPYNSSIVTSYLDAFGQQKLWLGGTTGYLFTGDIGNADNGTNIAVEVVTRPIALKYKAQGIPDLDQLYCFRHVEFHYAPNGGTSPITVSYCMDTPDGPYLPMVNKDTGVSTFIPGTGNRVRFDLAGYGRVLFVKFTLSSQEYFELLGMQAEGIELGRR